MGWGQYNCHQRSQWLCKLSCQPGKYKITLDGVSVDGSMYPSNLNLLITISYNEPASRISTFPSWFISKSIGRSDGIRTPLSYSPKERKCTYVNRKIRTDSNAAVLYDKVFSVSNLSFLVLLLPPFDFRPVVRPYCRACLKLWNKSGKGSVHITVSRAAYAYIRQNVGKGQETSRSQSIQL